jgi:hypothetical protein
VIQSFIPHAGQHRCSASACRQVNSAAVPGSPCSLLRDLIAFLYSLDRYEIRIERGVVYAGRSMGE